VIVVCCVRRKGGGLFGCASRGEGGGGTEYGGRVLLRMIHFLFMSDTNIMKY